MGLVAPNFRHIGARHLVWATLLHSTWCMWKRRVPPEEAAHQFLLKNHLTSRQTISQEPNLSLLIGKGTQGTQWQLWYIWSHEIITEILTFNPILVISKYLSFFSNCDQYFTSNIVELACLLLWVCYGRLTFAIMFWTTSHNIPINIKWVALSILYSHFSSLWHAKFISWIAIQVSTSEPGRCLFHF